MEARVMEFEGIKAEQSSALLRDSVLLPPLCLIDGFGPLPETPKLFERLSHSINQVNRMLFVYSDVFRHFGVDPHLLGAPSQVSYWMWLGLSGNLEKYLKMTTANLLARVLDQNELVLLPPHFEEAGCGPFGGPFGRHLKRILYYHRSKCGRRSNRSIQLAFSLYQGKAGSLTVPLDFVEAQVKSAVERLSSTHDDPCRDESLRKLLFKSVERVVDEVFPQEEVRTSTLGKDRIPSLRSSYQVSRKGYGAFGHIVPERQTSDVIGERVLLGFYHLRTCVLPIYGEDPEEYDHWIEESLKRARAVDRVNCKPVGLCEPFKVRVITRGDADVYHLCRRYQHTIHTKMSRHPTFDLTKGPITSVQLDRFWSIASVFSKKGWNIISGDYEAATDYLDPELSEYCLGLILNRIGCPVEDQKALLLALTGHRIFHGADRFGFVDQRWGQLMGSPISFPILCILNAAATVLSLELGGMWIPLECLDLVRPSVASYPLMINGDDVGFMADEKTYEIWKRVTRLAGLRFSVGKNYSHRDCLILNSAVFRVEPAHNRLLPLPHLQVGLLYGQSEKFCRPADRDEDTPFGESEFLGSGYGLSQMCRDLLLPWSDDQKDLLLSRFITVNRSRLERVPRGMSWFLPRHLGGLGLPHVRDPEVTDGQLRLAAYLATRSVDDSDLRDFIHPNLPLFLSTYLSERGWSAGKLGAAYREYTSFEEKKLCLGKESFPLLTSYALKGAWTDSVDHEGAIRKQFEELWRRAKQNRLTSMGKDKALAYSRPRARELVGLGGFWSSGSGVSWSDLSSQCFSEGCDCHLERWLDPPSW